MGDGVDIDTAVVADAGRRMRASAVALDEQAQIVGNFEFTGASAGRMYLQHGTALGEALKVVGAAFAEWSKDAESFGRAFQSSSGGYVDTDQMNADRVGGVQL